MKSLNNLMPAVLVIAGAMIVLLAFLVLQPHRAFGDVTTFQAVPNKEFRTYTFFATSTNQTTFATTTSATSTNIRSWTNSKGEIDNGYFVIAGANEVMFYFSRGDTLGTGNAGSHVFKVQVSPDGVNWYDYSELGQITTSTTGDQFFTRSASASLASGTSTQMWAMEDNTFYAVRCIAVRTTDGEATCRASADF